MLPSVLFSGIPLRLSAETPCDKSLGFSQSNSMPNCTCLSNQPLLTARGDRCVGEQACAASDTVNGVRYCKDTTRTTTCPDGSFFDDALLVCRPCEANGKQSYAWGLVSKAC